MPEESKDRSAELSPFVFRTISLSHVEIDRELVLKFRKANFNDHAYFRERYNLTGKGLENIESIFQDPLEVVNMIFHFLSKAGIKELLKIKFTDIDEKTGEEIPVEYPLKTIFQKILVSSGQGHSEIYNLFLEIFGWTKEQLDSLNGPKKKEIPEKATPPIR